MIPARDERLPEDDDEEEAATEEGGTARSVEARAFPP
jgi:hypothetical protein